MKIALPGYHARPEELAALRFILLGRVSGARCLLLEGAPGVGKTFLGEVLAKGQEWPLVFYQCHSWSSDQELFRSIDVAAAVAGDAAGVITDGALTAAAKHSLHGKVVLIVDELDKAPERVDALLLDFLQSGRVPLPRGLFFQGNQDHLVVLVTSNKVRELHPALVRRCRRLVMKQLPGEVLDGLIEDKANVGRSLARQIRRLCQMAAAEDKQESSLQEMVNLAEELKFAESVADVALAADGWAARGQNGRVWLDSKAAKEILGEIWRLVESCREE